MKHLHWLPAGWGQVQSRACIMWSSMWTSVQLQLPQTMSMLRQNSRVCKSHLTQHAVFTAVTESHAEPAVENVTRFETHRRVAVLNETMV